MKDKSRISKEEQTKIRALKKALKDAMQGGSAPDLNSVKKS